MKNTIYIIVIVLIAGCNSLPAEVNSDQYKSLAINYSYILSSKSIKNDYSYESLVEIEDYLQNVTMEDEIGSSFMIGAYFGEALVREYNGKWSIVDEVIAIQFENDIVAFPFIEVQEFFDNGQEDSFSHIFYVTKILVGE